MKRYNFILIAFLCTATCQANIPKADKDSLHKQLIISNKVHLIKKYEYEYNPGIIDSASRFLTNSDEYNQKGNLVTQLTYQRENFKKHFPGDSTVNIFDNNGNLLKSTQIKHQSSRDSSKTFDRYIKVFKNIFQHNKGIESSTYNNGELNSKIKYQYKSDGNLKGYTSYDRYGKFDLRSPNIYVNGEISGSEVVDKNDRILYRSEIIKKDKYHTVITVYKEKNVVLSVQNQELDDKGQIILDDFKMETFQSIKKYIYNDWGMPVSCTAYNNQHKPVSYTKFEIVKF